jgi:hypothetical protein
MTPTVRTRIDLIVTDRNRDARTAVSAVGLILLRSRGSAERRRISNQMELDRVTFLEELASKRFHDREEKNLFASRLDIHSMPPIGGRTANFGMRLTSVSRVNEP